MDTGIRGTGRSPEGTRDLDEGRVRMSQTIILDFVMLNALRETHAAEAAIGQAIGALRVALGTKE